MARGERVKARPDRLVVEAAVGAGVALHRGEEIVGCGLRRLVGLLPVEPGTGQVAVDEAVREP